MTLEAPYPMKGSDPARLSLLVLFLGAPTVWAVHLAASYFLVALDCGSDWNGGRTGVLLATVVCAVGSASAGVVGWRAWKRSRQSSAPSLDPPQVRGFLVLSGALLAALFTGAIILSGIAPLFLPMCGPG
jgi:hypothetical protein